MVDTDGIYRKRKIDDDVDVGASELSKAIGARLRDLRKKAGLSQSELAELMGSAGRKEVAAMQKKLSLLEKGRVEFKVVDLEAIATALGRPTAALLPGYVSGGLTAEEAALVEVYRLEGVGGLLAYLAPRVRETR